MVAPAGAHSARGEKPFYLREAILNPFCHDAGLEGLGGSSPKNEMNIF